MKFIEALDEREQKYYKIIFNSARRISNAIRNVKVIRKDMEEARDLMKGVKESATISAATSLSEAAKFLGLKWNIQDANLFTKEKAAIKLYPCNEEIQNGHIDLGKNSIFSETEQNILYSKFSNLSQENSIPEHRNNGEELFAKSKSQEFELNDLKEKENGSIEVNTENFGDILESDRTNGLSTPLEDSLNVLNNIAEDPQIKSDQVRQDPISKGPTENVRELINNSTNLKVESNSNKSGKGMKNNTQTKESVKTVDSVKEGEQNLQQFVEQEQPVAPTKLKSHKQKSASKKVISIANELSLEIGYPPAPLKAVISQSSDFNVDSKKDNINNAENGTHNRTTDSRLSNNTDASKQLITENSATSKEDCANGKENGNECIIRPSKNNKDLSDKNTNNISKSEGCQCQNSSPRKKIKEKENSNENNFNEEKLMDFIQVPGFMICVEASDGKLGAIEWGLQGLHVYCLQFIELNYDIVVRVSETLILIFSCNACVI